jgi:hypothetical protein
MVQHRVDMLFVPCSGTTAGCWLRHQHTLRVHGAAQGRHALRAHSAQDYCRVLAETSAYVSIVQHRRRALRAMVRDYCRVLAGHQHTLRVHSAATVDMLFVPVLGTTAGVLAGHQHTLRVHSAAQGRHALRAHSAPDYCRVLAETSAYSVSMVQHRDMLFVP